MVFFFSFYCVQFSVVSVFSSNMFTTGATPALGYTKAIGKIIHTNFIFIFSNSSFPTLLRQWGYNQS